MTSGKPDPICFWCKHFYSYRKIIAPYKAVCTAFPAGIPTEIFGDGLGFTFDHSLPHPSDNGLQFEMEEMNILLHRPFFRNFSPETVNMLYRSSLWLAQHNHRANLEYIKNPPPKPRPMHIIPIEAQSAENLRKRFRAWNLDLNDPSNTQMVSAEIYYEIYEDLETYVQYLEQAFADIESRDMAIETFAHIVSEFQFD